MAREEADREDLLAEARALVERAEIATRDGRHVVLGFREAGGLSLFFEADPVFQFNPAGELRRAFVGGRLLKADGQRLASLTRERAPGEVQLVRHDLTPDETAELLADLQDRLDDLRRTLAAGQFTLVGEVPDGAGVVARLERWLDEHRGLSAIAASPRVSP